MAEDVASVDVEREGPSRGCSCLEVSWGGAHETSGGLCRRADCPQTLP